MHRKWQIFGEPLNVGRLAKLRHLRHDKSGTDNGAQYSMEGSGLPEKDQSLSWRPVLSNKNCSPSKRRLIDFNCEWYRSYKYWWANGGDKNLILYMYIISQDIGSHHLSLVQLVIEPTKRHVYLPLPILGASRSGAILTRSVGKFRTFGSLKNVSCIAIRWKKNENEL